MLELDVFRQDLAGWFLTQARAWRRACGTSHVTGEPLRVAILLEHLAENAQHLDAHVFLFYKMILTHEQLSQHFTEQREALLQQIGVSYNPKSATEALRWMCRSVVEGSPVPTLRHARDLAETDERVRARPRRLRTWKAVPKPIFRSIGDDLCTGFSVAAPSLAIWYVPIALQQWREQNFVETYPAVEATIVSTRLSSEGRSSGSTSDTVLEFRPALSVGPCRVVVHTGYPPLAVPPGHSLKVVPRSPDCELPLIPSQVGDPLQTMWLIAALLIGGGVCLKPWRRLVRQIRPPRRSRSLQMFLG